MADMREVKEKEPVGKKLSQSDVDRLLRARAYVDAYREADKGHDAKAAAYQALKSMDAKSQSDAKVTTLAQISQIELNRTTLTDTMMAGLKAEGFETYDAFIEFNNYMNANEVYDLIITKESCEGCPTKGCVALYKDAACAFNPSAMVTDWIYSKITNMRAVYARNMDEARQTPLICPKGYGYQVSRTEPVRFDHLWRA